MPGRDVSGDGGVLLETTKAGGGVAPTPGQIVFAHCPGPAARRLSTGGILPIKSTLRVVLYGCTGALNDPYR